MTPRLQVGPWHVTADEIGVDLAEVITEMLTARTTMALPEAWRGDYSIDRARTWIQERDTESPTVLVVESASERPVGILILAEVGVDEDATVDLRIGFVLAEDVWGRGLATELLSGLIDWARAQPTVRTLTGGIDAANRASARALEKNGFRPIGERGDDTVTYRLDLEPG